MISGAYSRRLDIFITNRCNLRCEYCSSGDILRDGGALSLDAGRLAGAVDLFARYGRPGDAGTRTIAFSGGEPFLEFDALAKTITHIRRQKEKFFISVTTNGTLLDRERARFMADNGVCLIVSLDGTREATDRHRKFGSGKGSVFAAVTKNLRALPRALRPSHVAVTVTSGTIGSVMESAGFLEKLGFEYVEIGLDVYETWTPEKLALLRKTLAAFRNYALKNADLGALRRGGGNVFKSFFQDYDPGGDVLPVDTLCLSPEGFFFPCDALCAARPRRDEYVIGDLERGVDFKKFRRIYEKAFSFIRRHCPANSVLFPGDRYFYALTHGLDPAAILENGARVNEIFEEELAELKELESLALAAARSGGPEGAGGAPDPLASRGGDKTRVCFDGGNGRGTAAARAALYYLLLSARQARRKLSVFVER